MTVLAMVASLMAIAAPAGAAIDTSDACPDAIPSAGFTDLAGVPAAAVDAIDCIAFYEISTGTSATTFDPFADVERWQMALFLTRQAEVHDVTLPDGSDQGFTDLAGVPAAAVTAINQIAQLDISLGTSATTFDPFADVERWQMALFLTRLVEAAGVTLPDGSDQGFVDLAGVPDAAVVAINQLAQLEVSEGTTAITFDPFADVERWQMALFLTRTLQADGVTPSDLPAGVLSVTPGTDVELLIADEDERQYTASGLDNDVEYDLALVLTDDVTVDSGGNVTLEDDDDNGEYEPNASANAEISVINGSSAGVDATEVSPVGGQITFTVLGTGFADVTPILWDDSEDDDNVELNDDDEPAEDFGAGGAVLFIPEEAASAAFGPGPVDFVDTDQDLFVLGGATYFYEAGDTFTYTTNGSTLSQFEGALSVGDTVDGIYDQNFASEFNIATDVPGTPTGLDPTDIGNIDGEDDAFDVEFVWNAPDPADGILADYEVNVHEADDDDDVDTCAGALEANVLDSADGDVDRTLVVNDLANGDYCAQVEARSLEGSAGDLSDTVTFNVQSGDVDETAPTIDDTDVTIDAGTAGTLEAGDQIVIEFDEEMALTADDAGQVIRFTDADGATYDLEAGANATFTLGDVDPDDDIVNDTLTVDIIVPGPTLVTSDPDNAGAQLNGTIIDLSSGIEDLAGNEVDLAGSADVTIDNELD